MHLEHHCRLLSRTKRRDTSSKEKEEWELVWEDDFNRDDIFATGIWSKIWGCPTSKADWCKLQTDYIDLLRKHSSSLTEILLLWR